MRKLEVRELGRLPYGEAWALQKELAEQRKQGLIPDQLLLVEHPHVLTMGRNAHEQNLLVGRSRLAELGIEYFEIDRGGDVTYHGPGQVVGYPILDLREWKRDVVAYLRALEEVILATLRRFGIEGHRDAGATGVWTPEGKICAMGVHISRWVTTHGFALNWTTDLSYFQHIVPCGLMRPVASMESLGVRVEREAVHRAIVEEFARVFEYEPAHAAAGA
ncbi:MAG: lipoyl(octanoyl) transferase LipB [Acidobacteria bacterium]|nr:lipoyl(octanoyl) transferase LipB [Acidobacteriota bacterium]